MPLFILFTVGMIAGAVRAYRLVMANRKAGQRDNTLYEWLEKPLPSWKYEYLATTALLIHTLSTLVLGFLALRAASNQGLIDNPLFAHDTTMISLVWFIQYGCILVVSYHLGSVLISFPLIVFRSQSVAIAITDKGISYGMYFMPWDWFSHFSIDRDGGILRLYSAFSLDLPSLTLKLPESISVGELDDTMDGFLPIRLSEGNHAWYRTKLLLIPTMLLACLLVIALGWLASLLSMELSLFVIALLTSLLVFLGGLILNPFAFGVVPTRNNSPRIPPTA